MATQAEILSILRQAGFKGNGLRTAYGIVMRESGGRADAFNGNTGTGDRSLGWFQLNMLGNLGPSRLKQWGLSSEKQLYDPLTNAKAAYQLSKNGSDFGAWGIGPNAYRSGAGYDTIAKYVEGLPTGKLPGVRLPAGRPPALTGDRSAFFADAIKEGRWSIGAPLSQTVSLTREFNKAYGNKPIPGALGLKYPKVQGRVTPGAAEMVKEAYRWLGTPYSWAGGGTGGPSKGVGRGANTVGFDCSGLLQYLWGKRGVSIPRVTYDQWRTGTAVGKDQLQPGDAVFFRMGPRGPEHVAMYVGDGKIVEAPRTGDVVKISSLSGRGDYVGARRYA